MRRATQPSRTRSPRAFTLTELAIVLVILGTLAAIGTPRFVEAMHRYQSQLTARRIAGELERVRTQARSQRQTLSVAFIPSSESYEIKDSSDAVLSSVSLDPDDDAAIHAADFSESTTVQFDGFGVPSSSGSVIVESGGWYSTVTVAEETGNITLSDWPRTSP